MKKETADEIVGRALRGEPYVPTGADEGGDAPAQPAAPQGVAYADLDDAFESWLEDQDVDRLSDGYESWLDSVRSCWDAALRASNGQAPAGAAIARVVLSAQGKPASDVHLIAKGDELDAGLFDATYPHRAPHRIANLVEHATAQAAPAPTHEQALEDALRERDEADDFIDTLLDEVLGADRAEWSSAYGRAEALEDVRERITALHKPTVDRAWDQFQAATAQAAPAAGAVAGPAMPAEFLRSVIALCTHRGYSPENIEAWSKDDKWVADLWRQAEQMLAAAPTPAAQADSQPSSFGSPELQAMILARCVEKDKADSVLEDAARLAKITQAIRDYHFALDNREHGGVAMARAWNAICDVLNMDWVQGAESAAREQGGTR